MGYAAWSLIDQFEWNQGYDERFGLFYINYTESELYRQPKQSAIKLSDLFKNRGWISETTSTTNTNLVTTDEVNKSWICSYTIFLFGVFFLI